MADVHARVVLLFLRSLRSMLVQVFGRIFHYLIRCPLSQSVLVNTTTPRMPSFDLSGNAWDGLAQVVAQLLVEMVDPMLLFRHHRRLDMAARRNHAGRPCAGTRKVVSHRHWLAACAATVIAVHLVHRHQRHATIVVALGAPKACLLGLDDPGSTPGAELGALMLLLPPGGLNRVTKPQVKLQLRTMTSATCSPIRDTIG